MAAVELCDEILRLIDDVLAVADEDGTELRLAVAPGDDGERPAPAP